ncbi:2-amino-3,7-dideoxy-D-threo-hept-6-ulosonate synthase [Desulfosporosinus sp. Sb-LF]|uniref:2-amino-3,7-dideoxy-D-threo-hept-6-ulosonate synthase n=1 Tax=Desulfosporosinus sp. Sb-LF TaxID=2560027 RepID=UPI00107FA8FA|nr:2-amino-3,7-dideoxy-D-threo-hept-6-ulosonate synthase [Desulfosporosinus sp. Sb-LF]TGE32137.1 fructose-bisphosphate aldolase [Desulfosporosinus sp. Sb-LF]
MTGKEVRLNRLFKHSERMIIVPLDHGVSVGPIQGLEDIPKLVKQVNKGRADAVVVQKGLVPQIKDYLGGDGCELIVHLSASTALSPNSNRKELVATVEQAIRLGATAVSIHVNLGNSHESEMLRDFGKVSNRCDQWGIPLLAMMYVRDGSNNNEFDWVKLKHAARVAEELGADIIKVNYTGNVESFSEVVNAVKLPVVIAGGPKTSSVKDLLIMINEAIRAGAKGTSIGRNIFQSPDPEKLVRVIRQILDSKMTNEGIKELARTL